MDKVRYVSIYIKDHKETKWTPLKHMFQFDDEETAKLYARRMKLALETAKQEVKTYIAEHIDF